jgi:hypothetical protein
MATGFQVTFDAADPLALASFWAEVLGYVLQPPPPGFATWDAWADTMGIPVAERDRLAAIVDPAGEGPRVLFQKVPEAKVAKNRVHLDVNAGAGYEGEARRHAVDREVDRLVAHGAVRIATHDSAHEYWTVLQDPEGNEFCVQ